MTTRRRSPAPLTASLDAPDPTREQDSRAPGGLDVVPAEVGLPPTALPGASGGRAARGPLPLLRRAPGAPPAVVAHRGSSSTAPENTLAAFEAARRAGAPWIETDLRRTRDGVAVVLHDEGLERTTDGAGALAVSSAADVAALDAGSWFSPGFCGARVPRLGELLEWAATHPETHLLLELKGRWSAAEAGDVAAAVRDLALGERVVLQSFDPLTVAACAAVAPDLALGLLLRARGAVDPADTAEVTRLVRDLGLSAVNPGVDEVLADPSLVERLHRLGAAVWVWTVDDAARWARLEAEGVDGIITNRPDRMLGWVEGRVPVPAPRRPSSAAAPPTDAR
ncbi:glycerophosphodiester phosphodiesterase [uncultured Pseudokineococcus sp.]|uniref:glycerophosphodiester phosphodiesterase n=1 Tax=uncultured Pseudokineococcus sp. TaxID=1642928 RepID=UPI00262C8286|nr:glycerophosphodiester phosphodiesterase [uncultured Pseudokineococcus sp.]